MSVEHTVDRLVLDLWRKDSTVYMRVVEQPKDFHEVLPVEREGILYNRIDSVTRPQLSFGTPSTVYLRGSDADADNVVCTLMFSTDYQAYSAIAEIRALADLANETYAAWKAEEAAKPLYRVTVVPLGRPDMTESWTTTTPPVRPPTKKGDPE